MTSPYLTAAFTRAHGHSPAPSPQAPSCTFYHLLARWPGELRLWTIEWPEITSQQEAIEAIEQNSRVVRVLRCDPDIAQVDISREIAEAMLQRQTPDAPPAAFLREHLSEDELALAGRE